MDYDKILKKLEQKAKYAELRDMGIKTSMIVMKNGVVSGVVTTEEHGIAIRVIDRGIGFVTTNSTDFQKIDELIDKAVKSAKSINKAVNFSVEEPVVDKWSVEEREKIENLSIEEKLQYLKEVESTMSALNIPMKVQLLRDKIVEKLYINTEGTKIEAKVPSVSYFFMIGIMENNNFEQSIQEFGRTGGYEAWKEWNVQERIKHETEALKKVIKSKKLNSGKMDILIGPEISGIVAHESAGHPSEADRIFGREAAQAGESFIKSDMIGMQIGSKYVNVIDDPEIEHSFGYYKYDEEGVKSRKRYLYKAGLIHEFLTNREYAYKLHQKSNGAARSSWWNREPIVRMSTTYIEPKDYTFEELVEDIKYGVYMRSFTEWNIDDVRFNEKYIGREAYLIEHGEIANPVKRPVLEITTTGFYNAVDAVGKDLEFFAGSCGKSDPMQGVDVWMGGPHLRLRNVYVG